MPQPPTLVLGYHNVLPTAAFGGDADGLPAFREQLRMVARRCAVVPMGEAGGRTATRRPTVALTFDDGYLDNTTLVADLLTEVGLTATFFLVTSFLDGTDYPWWEVVAAICAHPAIDRVAVDGELLPLSSPEVRGAARRRVEAVCTAAPLARRDELLSQLLDSAGTAGADAVAAARARTPMMGWGDAKALVDAGFTIGSHTARHCILARDDAAVVSDQLATSKQALEAGLGIDVSTFAYPRGTATDIDDDAVRLVGEAGFRHAVTTVPGVNVTGTAPLRLRRLVMEPDFGTTALLRAVASQLGGAAARSLFSLAPPARRAIRTPRPSA